MKLDEWKALFNGEMEKVNDAFTGIASLFDVMEDIDDDYDEDELAAYLILKFKKMENKIEKIFKV